MLCDRVLGRWTADDGVPGDDGWLDWLDLAWGQCHRRALQSTTRRGRAVRLLLRVGTTLRHGDVLADTPECLLVVQVALIETLVVRPRAMHEAAAVAME